MKKLLIIICLTLSSMSAIAQKSYIFMVAYMTHWSTGGSSGVSYSIYLSGDLPAGFNSFYSTGTGEMLNILASKGYTVESMCDKSPNSSGSEGGPATVFLLSKNSSSPSNVIQMVNSDDEEVTEVARYNLQGIPVKKSEKGIQIVVYSNYTTKTVVVQ